MKKHIATGLALTIGVIPLLTPRPAQAGFGDFMIGVGVTAGAAALINSERRAQQAEQQRAVSPDDEFFRGVQDAMNGLPYDNPRNSLDYDSGFQEGLRRRQGQ